MKRLIPFLLALLCILTTHGQDSSVVISSKYIGIVKSKASALSEKLDKKSATALAHLQKQENRIKRKLFRLDSSRAKELFDGSKARYEALMQKLDNSSSPTQYIPYLDTLTTSFSFLEKNKSLVSKAVELDKNLSEVSDKLKDFGTSVAKAEDIKAFIKERRAFLKEQLKNLPFAGELKKLNKQAYYYSAQVNEYKEALRDSKKLERKAITILSKTKLFRDFMRKNSQLASLFRIPDPDDLAGSTASLAGLQTRAGINTLIQDRIGTGANVQAMLQENMQSAQTQLSQLKDNVAKFSNGSFGNNSSDTEIPDFKPNNQRTKSFLKRLEFGGNVQTQKARQYFPVTSDVGLSLGYKLNDKSVIGIGGSYKLGLGRGWNDIKFTNEGIGLRSFIDYKIKGSLFVSGGYEQNYRNAFYSIDQLRNLNSWQSSGLIGLSKKYSISKKLSGNAQLLWDFLSYRQQPRTQAVLFRVGYSLK
jgi:hypothetical protein